MQTVEEAEVKEGNSVLPPAPMPKWRHTPGPWEVRWRFGRLTTVVGRQRHPICDTATAPIAQANCIREEANARLIAAAPDLLERAVAFLRAYDATFASDTAERFDLAASLAANAAERQAADELRSALSKLES